jgi:L-fucose mutarotase/ribose pyranase (RbsD/FucU family)
MEPEAKIREAIRSFGHRNWIVVADAAYPAHSSPAIETIVVDDDLEDMVAWMLKELPKASHVKPKIWVDAELPYMVHGALLRTILAPHAPSYRLHEANIAALDEAAKLFKVLVIKTSGLIAYTSVFFELDCGYWTAEDEQTLREEMARR